MPSNHLWQPSESCLQNTDIFEITMSSNPETQSLSTDTIAAIATPPGRGGVGIIRVSGPQALAIGEAISQQSLTPRYAHFSTFYDNQNEVLDEGLILYFPNPHSFTGEDVVELQGHGGPVILDCLLRETFQLGARPANPGEFSERAFLNDKLDLTQAEAIADLIDASSEQAARNAVRSLQGNFSKQIHSLEEQLIQLRIYVEAAIDFPEEEIDFLSDGKVAQDLSGILQQLEAVFQSAKQGAILREGMSVVIAGRPNAGKSSLLNALSGRDSAIVTDIAGTTRDVLREYIQLDGLPVHIIDTAGLRDAPDEVERIGIERAWKEIEQADKVILVVDATTTADFNPHTIWPEFIDRLPEGMPITVVANKADLSGHAIGLQTTSDTPVIHLCAKTSDGIEQLEQHLKQAMGYQGASEGGFTARRRHIQALEQTLELLKAGENQLLGAGAGELLAEDLRQAQHNLGEITGEFSADELLGRIFSSFCIGK